MKSFITLYQNDNTSKCENQIQKDFKNDVSTTRTSIEKITKLKNQLYKQLKKTINNQVKYYNKKHTFRFFNVENKILLNFKNIHIFKSSKKFNHKYYELFKIKKFIEK
jgi:hypothetical protein